MKLFRQKSLACVLAFCVQIPAGFTQFVAFNDFAPGAGTHPNATTYGPPSSSGFLKDISSGSVSSIRALVFGSGLTLTPDAGSPAYATPAFIVFDGFVDFVGEPNPSIELSATASFTYFFSGLDPASEYNLQATAIRGEQSYSNRWSLFELTGSRGFASVHSAGCLTSSNVASITASQVAINTGDNVQGDLAWWEHIHPSIDGTFSLVSKKYSGPVPNGASDGATGYGVTGFRLQKSPTYIGRTNVPPRNPVPTTGLNGIKTVFIIMMENHNWSSIVGSTFCPYINDTLLPISSYATRYFTPAGLHPSEPNYIWLIAGNNFGIRNDSSPDVNHISSTNNLFTLLDHANISWKTYQENISGTDCPVNNNYPYAPRHNPFVFFDSVRLDDSYCISHVRPYSELATDLANNTVRRFNFITPNVTNDMHDTASGSPSSRKQGDDWLAAEVPKILASQAYADSGLLIITWDEGSNDSDGPIGMIVLSPRAKGHGYNNAIRYTHSSTLRTLQDIFGVRPYLGDAANAENLQDLFVAPELVRVSWQTSTIQFTVTNLTAFKTNLVQASTTLTSGSWVNIQTNVSTNTSMIISDPTVPLPPYRFYRVIELP